MAATSELRRSISAEDPAEDTAENPGENPAENPGERLRNLRESLPAPLRASLQSGRELARERREAADPGRRPSGTPALDRLLEGGLPAGCLIEIVGRRSDGRFSAVLAALAAATTRGEAAALVDLGDGLDPRGAERAGARLENLLWVRPRTVQEALLATEHLLTGGFPLVALDLGSPPIPGGRGTEAAWLRLSRAAAAQRAVLLVTTPWRATGTSAAVVLAARRRRAAWSGRGREPRLLEGLEVGWGLEKSRALQGAGWNVGVG